eukprot:10354399-Ditylum_brightwellii.AAC.1
MRIKINGAKPHLDSPTMLIPTGETQAIAFRYRYVGHSKFGKFRLRGGSAMPDIVDHGFSDWDNEDDELGRD